ncbi:MAG: antibiotic biosynthesis monooxygenase [Sphingomonadales bacterium]|nr:antibiotic biosynthesis monooxygenase [Sphingomonadales bacterium]
MAKIVISAQIDLEPAQRDDALRSAQPWIDGALSQPGCIHYDWSADLNNPARVNVFEEWESEGGTGCPLCWPAICRHACPYRAFGPDQCCQQEISRRCRRAGLWSRGQADREVWIGLV